MKARVKFWPQVPFNYRRVDEEKQLHAGKYTSSYYFQGYSQYNFSQFFVIECYCWKGFSNNTEKKLKVRNKAQVVIE